MMRQRNILTGMNVGKILFAITLVTLICHSCTVSRFIEEDELFLKRTKVVSDNHSATKSLALADYILQTPNTKWFGMKVPLGTYCLSGVDTTNWATRMFRKLGEEPVIYDKAKAEQTCMDMIHVLNNEGYMDASVTEEQEIKNKKLTLTYHVNPGKQYNIRTLTRIIEDKDIQQLLESDDTLNSHIHPGQPFNINQLNNERNRITTYLRDNGYYKFNKDYITFLADTLNGETDVDLTMNIRLFQADSKSEPTHHHQFRIGEVTYHTDLSRFRPSLLSSHTLIHPGKLYSETDEKLTYRYFTGLQAISYSNIHMTERSDSDILDCNIRITPAPQQSLGFDLEGTNTAGDLGAAASLSYQHKNIFKGSEKLTMKLRGAYEAITGLEGYEGNSYMEFGGEASIAFPGFILPFISREFGATHSATSEVSVQYNLQNRPEFNRRVLTAAWRYRWYTLERKIMHRYDLLEINYVRMPWISSTFREEYLDSLGKTNAILKYNYEDILITKMGYSFTYNSLGTSVTTTYGKNASTFRFNIETSGNLLGLLTPIFGNRTNSLGQNTFCGIAFAQYVRGDFDYARSFRIDKNNSIAYRIAFGIAYPYGNSDMLPFEKRYFSGGANSVRGWSVRSLGPGSYNGADKNINFINQSGDIKLDFSIEYRAFLFWKLNGAIFIDGGNIWTIRDYADQPGGKFRLGSFHKEIAFAYGLGLRLNMDFFILRFDAGMKAINPAYEGKDHYPIIHPDLSRDFAFHFAVGLPF